MSLRFEVRDFRNFVDILFAGNYMTFHNFHLADDKRPFCFDEHKYIFNFACNLFDNNNFDNLSFEITDTKMCDMIKGFKKPDKVKGMSFYTIVPKERLNYDAFTIGQLASFCEEMFNTRGDKYFKQCWYVIESGKHQQRPNLHVHLLADFKKLKGASGSKFFLRDLKTLWKKYFHDEKFSINYNIEGNKGIDRVDCNTLEIQQDKITYMDNDCKGTHENFTDLGIHKHLVF